MGHNKFTEQQMIAISLLSASDRNGLTVNEIAEKSGTSRNTIFRWKKDENFINEIKKRNPEYNTKDPKQEKKEEAIKLLAEKNLSANKICGIIGVSTNTFSNWKKDENFMGEVLKLNPLYYKKDLSDVQLEAIELLSEPKYRRLTKKEIAKKLNIGIATIFGWLKRDMFNLELKKRTDEKILINGKFSDVQLEAIRLLTHYKKKNLTKKAIWEKLNIGRDALNVWLEDPDFLAAIKKEEENDTTDYLHPIKLRMIQLVSNELKKSNNLYRIATWLGISYATLISWLEEADIKKLVIKAAQDKNIQIEKTPFSLLSSQPVKIKIDEEILDETNTYSKKQVMELLSINYNSEFSLIVKQNPIPFIYTKGNYRLYSKNEVDSLVVIQKQLLSEYITFEQIQDMLSGTGITFTHHSLKDEKLSEEFPAILRPFYKWVTILYKKDDVLAWKERQQLIILANDIILDNPYETFLYKLEIKEKLDDTLYLNNFGPFTRESWLSFVRYKITNSTARKTTLNELINLFIQCTLTLNRFLESKKSHEIYSFTSSEINMFFKGITRKYAESIYIYLKDISGKYEEVKKRAFKMDNITNPFDLPRKKMPKEIYDYQIFKDIMKFCNYISFQKERAILDVIEEINNGKKKKKKKYYESSWLYILMHLNNAWRHSDVITFPRISLEGTSIVDLEWLKENDISPIDADFIVNQIQRKDLTISKTQVKNYFFISDELKLAFATAVAICELRVQKLSPLRTNIIDFGTKENDLTEAKSRNFFEELDNEDFVFSSRKMNRTLMSYVYSILSKIKGSEYALKVVQNMRGHVDEESTMIYVDLTQEAVDDLTKQLFDRGSFGFIYDTFIDFINGVELDRNKRTLEIQSLKNNFGSLENVEHLSGFINSMQQERQAIMDTIYSLGLEEARLYINQIHANVMLGKDKATQCLVYKSKGCLKPHLPCVNCVFSIPNYYTLSVLVDSLERRLGGYLDILYSENKNYYEQRKYTRLLYTELDSFFEAKGKFDEEVYNFLSISKEDFIGKLMELPAGKENFNLE